MHTVHVHQELQKINWNETVRLVQGRAKLKTHELFDEDVADVLQKTLVVMTIFSKSMMTIPKENAFPNELHPRSAGIPTARPLQPVNPVIE